MCDGSYEHGAWRFYVQDMLKFAEKVLAYTDGMDLAAFLSDEQTYDATLHNILLIGEAASNIPTNVRDAHLAIPWHAIIGTRNRIVHGYTSISDSVIWSIIEDAIPKLVPDLRAILDSGTADDDSNSIK